jgi:hypothetical protein
LAVVPIHDGGGLFSETSDRRTNGNEPGAPGGGEAEVLVEVVIVETRDGRFQDVGREGRTGRNTPAPVLKEQGGLGLGSGKAELACE